MSKHITEAHELLKKVAIPQETKDYYAHERLVDVLSGLPEQKRELFVSMFEHITNRINRMKYRDGSFSVLMSGMSGYWDYAQHYEFLFYMRGYRLTYNKQDKTLLIEML